MNEIPVGRPQVPDVSSKLKGIKIPSNYKLSEGHNYGTFGEVNPLEVDEKARYLKLSVHHLGLPSIVEYFFDSSGKPTAESYRLNSEGKKHMLELFKRPDLLDAVSVWRNGKEQYFSYEDFIGSINVFLYDNVLSETLSSSSEFGFGIFETPIPYSTIELNRDGDIVTFRKGNVFAVCGKENKILRSPTGGIYQKEGIIRKPTKAVEAFEPIKPDKFLLFAPDREGFYREAHDVAKDYEGKKTFKYELSKKDNFFVLSETHLESKTTKKIWIPLHINMKKVVFALSAKPPYRRENDQLLAPWKDLDKIIGVSVSYSES